MLGRLTAYLRGLARRRQIESDVEDELRFHLEQEVKANAARGMSSASPNSCTRSCHGAAFSCQRYSACNASLRATLRVPLNSRVPCGVIDAALTGAP